MTRQRALVLAVMLAGCTCPAPVREPEPARAELITVPSAGLGPQPVVVLLPEGYRRTQPAYPLLIAFSGRAEAQHPAQRGAWGWVRDYQLVRQVRALERGRLQAADLLGLVSAVMLTRYNRSLAAAPYRGMVVACPYTFDLLGAGRLRQPAHERFYLDELPQALRRRYNVRRDPRGLGLDGVSLGGLWSLYLGFLRPEVVGQIGALQPAVTPFVDELVALAARNRGGLAGRPIGLVTSTGDGLRPVIDELSAGLHRVGVEHGLSVLEGPHDYAFNQGPGGTHMLLWHDRAFSGRSL